tara:strand:- start:196 stop:681 length:486 start_codon:yes stop_codon:yes gene_type:complete
MASTIKASTLTVTIKEDIKLNGVNHGGEQTLRIAGVNEVFKRIVSCPADVDTTVVTFDSGVNIQDGSLMLRKAVYLRITNLDASNSVNMSLQISADSDGEPDDSATIFLEPGRSFIMGTLQDGIAVEDDDANIETTLVDLESVLIDPVSNEVDIEVFVAST